MTTAGTFVSPDTLFHDRYRTIPEAQIVEMLTLSGFAHAVNDPASATASREALRDWADGGLRFVMSGSGARLFDPVEVWVIMRRLGRAHEHPFWREREIRTGRRLIDDFAAAPARKGPFTVELSRTFDLADVPPARPLRLRLPIPLGTAHERSVTLLPNGDDAGNTSVHAGRIERRCHGGGEEVTLAARVTFSAPDAAASDPSGDIYLRPREGLIVVSDRVRDLANRLAGPGSTVVEAVRAFWVYLIEGFVCGPIHYDQIDADAPCDWPLDTGMYDCQLGAALFVALCRASDIPARLVGGHVLYRPAPANHFWAEYRDPDSGWTPVDFYAWGLSAGGEDPVWRDRFFGRIDTRLITQILPLDFTGTAGIALPPAWHMLNRATDGGMEIALTRLDGRPLYTDSIRLVDP